MPYKKLFFAIIILSSFSTSNGQALYFPPLTGDVWETISPISLGWCDTHIDSMYDMLEENNSKALIILKDGKIVLEKYFGTFDQDSFWYWASAGKSLTACLVGIAQQEGLLSIEDVTSTYLGEGWTACTPEQEEKITIRDQLAMTSGLDDNVEDPFCTLDTCLLYKADAGTRWAYHNGPYTLLDGVIENATGQNLNAYFQQKIRLATGITGFFLQSGYNNVFFSQPRSMARFGLMIFNNGNWNGQQILTDENYFNSMVNTSQNLNLSYGYLWWLNGKSSYMLPGVQFQFPGSLMPNAPDDMIAALGKNGQYVDVVPSLGMVVIRMGNAPGEGEVPLTLNDLLWEHIKGLNCGTTAIEENESSIKALKIFPNPATDIFSIQLTEQYFDLYVYDAQGKLKMNRVSCYDHENVRSRLSAGIYFVKVVAGEMSFVQKMVVSE